MDIVGVFIAPRYNAVLWWVARGGSSGWGLWGFLHFYPTPFRGILGLGKWMRMTTLRVAERTMRLRVGLIGLGDYWDRRYGPALRALGDRFEVRAVCEQVAHRAETAAHQFRATQVDGFRALTAREDIDAVLILAPQWYGSLPILAACEAGKAVYCAAGMSFDPTEAALVKERVEQAEIAFMAEFPRRHAPATLRLKELVVTRLGAPQLLFCHQRRAASTQHEATISGCGQGRSVGCELVELVDWCRYVVGGEPTRVTGLMHSSHATGGENDYQMMSLDFSSSEELGAGAVAQISCGRYIPADWHEAIGYRPLAELQVSCERGMAFVDLPASLVWFDEAGRHQESLDSERPLGEQLLAQFYLAATGCACNPCDLDDVYRAVTIVEQARRSHCEGRRLAL